MHTDPWKKANQSTQPIELIKQQIIDLQNQSNGLCSYPVSVAFEKLYAALAELHSQIVVESTSRGEFAPGMGVSQEHPNLLNAPTGQSLWNAQELLWNDIEPQQAEIAFQRIRQFQVLFEQAAIGIGLTDLRGRWIQANPVLQNFLGYSAEELSRMTFREITHPDDLANDLSYWQDMLAGRITSYQMDKRYFRKDGQLIWGNLTVSLIRDHRSEPQFTMAVIKNITERKHTEEELKESQRKLTALINSLPGIVFSCHNDHEWSMRYLSEGCLKLTGYSSQELVEQIGVSYNSITHPEDLPTVLWAIDTAIAQKQPYVVEYRILTKSGQEKWLWEKGSGVFDEGGAVLGLEGFITDITDLKHAEELLHQQSIAIKSAIDGMAILNLQGEYIYLNNAHLQMYGYDSAQELIGQTWENLYTEEEIFRFRRSILPTVWREGQWQGEALGKRRDGNVFPQEISITAMSGRGLVYVVRDITERKQAESQLLHNAFHDELTGLSNRALFMDRLTHVHYLTKRRQDYAFAVLFLDLDRFKVVNDSLGHMAGDQLLIQIALRLKAQMRIGDTIARLGGDEFAILLENMHDLNEVKQFAERIQRELASPFKLNEHEVFTTASIGIALSTARYEQPESLLRDADLAMYHAKAQGKARYEVFSAGMHEKTLTLLRLETDLRRATERQEFELLYQPIVCLETGQLIGFEALIRWQHPERGLISPEEFIPVAEETGMIIPIGYWVLRQSCSQMASWQVQFPEQASLSVSVNLSGKQFGEPDLIEQITQILEETYLNASRLKLEITESVLMENDKLANKMLRQLKALGVDLHMDDFGTGYSSLGYLHRFPIDMLKIDRSFVSNLGKGNENTAIIQTIVALGQNLGIEVTAEGVETVDQLAQLRQMNCQHGQGYFFSKPVNARTAEQIISGQLQFQPYISQV
ncbi:MAG: EAL domain-containing protein [Leptolyngbyaceae bacterium]|nr:EAL domain-containing protein [Leptolyngbyaceae bacterium]